MKGWIEVEKCPLCGAEGEKYNVQNVASDAVTMPFGPYEMQYAYRSVFYRCMRCGFSYQNPTMGPELQRYYYESGLYRSETGQLVENLDLNEKQRGQRIINVMEALGIIPQKPFHMLDVGCSRGFLLDMMVNKHACTIEGVDLNDKYCQLPIKVSKTLNDVPNWFDLITAIHVLEHQSDPVSFLKDIRKHLADGGKLVVEVPFLDGPYRLPHPVVFEPHTLGLAMKLAGFDVKTVILKPHLLVVAVKS